MLYTCIYVYSSTWSIDGTSTTPFQVPGKRWSFRLPLHQTCRTLKGSLKVKVGLPEAWFSKFVTQ